MTKDFASDALRGLLGRKTSPWIHALLAVLSTAVFYGFAYSARYALLDEFSGYRVQELIQITAATFTALYAVAISVQLWLCKKLPLISQLLLCMLTGLVMLAKISLLDYMSNDYEIFLSDWIYAYSHMGIKEGLGTYIGSDYTPPYLYLMLLISRVDSYPWQYMVKAITMLFEVLLAYGVLKIASLRVKGEGAQMMIFHITLMLPTVVFNGAYWGQCDAIYVSFCMLGLYLGLRGKGVRSMICFGVAFSFKLQTVFFLPVLLPLWLRKDIKLRHVLMIPVAYLAMMIPAFWGGKSLHHALTCYITQAGNYNFMSMNGPSIYNLLPSLDSAVLYNLFSAMGYTLGFAALLLICLLVSRYRERLTNENTLLTCLLVLGGVPFFLPKMHERYTFGADVLSLVVVCYRPRRIALPLLYGLASYICYTAGLPGDNVLPLKWASLFQGTAVALTAFELWRGLNEERTDGQLAEVKA